MRRLIISIGLLLSTAACTTVEPLRPDMEARPVPSRLDEIAYINGLRAAYQEGSGSAASCYLGTDLKAFRPKFVQGYRETDPAADEAKAGACIQFRPMSAASNDTKQARLIQDYLDNGFGLTDLYCSRFIMVASEERQSRRLQRNTASAVGALVSVVLNAVNAGENAMSIATGAFTGIDTTYKNIDDAFVISPDKESLIRLIQNAQDAYRTQSREKPPRSFAEARSKVERYASFCTYDGMRALVNGSVDKAAQDLKAENKPAGEGDQKTPKPAGTEVAPKPEPAKPKPTTDALIPG